ncbi:MAG: hypothetical protein KDH15_13095 [Rhodocyclaceae bacterium]|nr:hypothetical protein [Rhodocyclaceae bacterium]
MSADSFRLLDCHRPALEDGRYVLEVRQHLTRMNDAGHSETLAEYSARQGFLVQGPRYALAPDDVVGVYPPAGSRGHFGAVVPHVILGASTLPWERSPSSAAGGQQPPWLALVLVHEDDGVLTAAVPLSRLDKDLHADFPERVSKLSGPGQVLVEPGEAEAQMVAVVDLPAAIVDRLLPAPAHRALLVHVRVRGEADSRAVVVARQSPRLGVTTAHLVSLEGRYDGDGFKRCDAAKSHVRFVSLYSWRFRSEAATRPYFDTLVHGLDVGTLRLPAARDNADAEHFLAQGAVALPREGFDGGGGSALYHGPLVPWRGAGIAAGDPGPAPRAAPGGPIPELQVDDLSHAAAWELGRLMLLHDPGVARRLYAWKCHSFQGACCEALAASDARHRTDHLPCRRRDDDHPFPFDWFDRLMRLEGVPFGYLVATPQMLPPESLRRFEVERRWIESLVDGAFLVGSLGGAQCAHHEQAMRAELHARIPRFGGFLLRSAMVSGWPELRVAVSAKGRAVEPIVRRLSRDTLLCLFDGGADRVELAVPDDHRHFEPPAGNDEFPGRFRSAVDLARACLVHGHSLALAL